MQHLGPLEMMVMTVVREKAPAGVQEVVDGLAQSGSHFAYTTILTILARLQEKGFLSRVREGRRYLYSPEKRGEAKRLGLFSKLRGALFGSERLAPVVALLDTGHGLDVAELEELKALIDERIESQKKRKGKRG